MYCIELIIENKACVWDAVLGSLGAEWRNGDDWVVWGITAGEVHCPLGTLSTDVLVVWRLKGEEGHRASPVGWDHLGKSCTFETTNCTRTNGTYWSHA